MGDKKREKVVYNIVDSVKGGCGKSTFAIMLALALDKINADDVISRDKSKKLSDIYPNTCLVDVDLQGTALQYLLFGNGYRDVRDKDMAYYNEKIVLLDKKFKKFVDRCNWGERKFDLVLCSPEQAVKNCYRSLSKQNDTPEIMCGSFRYGFRNMLSRLQERGDYCYDHIIFDMPPNSDGYSDAVFYNILHSDNCIMDKECGDKCNLFLMQTLDIGHRLATMKYFNDLATREQYPKIDKLFLVYSDFLDFGGKESKFREVISFAKKKIDFTIDKDFADKIYFLAIPFFKDYYEICSESDGISNGDMPEGITAPIKFLHRYDGSWLPNPTIRDLINLINGKEEELKWDPPKSIS